MRAGRRRAGYSPEPPDPDAFSQRFDRLYTRFAGAYDVAVRVLPMWRRWLSRALPHIEGPRVLEVSPGTGWLLTRYAGRFRTCAVDLNPALLAVAQRNLNRAGVRAALCVGTVEALPYRDGVFDTVLTTMAFSGYPDGARARDELLRVARPGGRLIVVDVDFPADGNGVGSALVGLWRRTGDVIRDLEALLAERGVDASNQEIGGFGSVHLYLASKPS